MPDNPNFRGDGASTMPARADDATFREQTLRLAYTQSTIRCHQPARSNNDFSTASLDSFLAPDSARRSKDKQLEELLRQLPPVKPTDALPPVKPLDVRAEVPPEVKVKTEAEKFLEADPISKTSIVISRLPDFKLSFADKKLSLETDFTKLLEATPGVDLGADLKTVVGAAKKVSLDGDKFTLDLTDVARLKIDRDIAMVGKLTDLRVGDGNKQLKFEVEFDPKNPALMSIKNISGLSLERQGKEPLAIHALVLDSSKDSPALKVTIDNPLRLGWTKENSLAKTITVPVDLGTAAPGLSADFLKGMVKTLSDSKAALQNRDASMLFSGLPDEAVRERLVDLFKGLQTVEKSGKQITLVRDNGDLEHNFGGPRLRVSPVVRCQVEAAGGGIDVCKIEGVRMVTALPAQAGLGSEFSVGIKGVSLSSKYGPRDNESRSLTVRADALVDSVRVKLNAGDLMPSTDANGDWRLDVSMRNPLDTDGKTKLFLPLKFNQSGSISNSPGEIAGMARDVLQGGAKANVVKAVGIVDSKANQLAGAATRALDVVDQKAAQAADLAVTTARATKYVVKEEIRQTTRLLGDLYDYMRR